MASVIGYPTTPSHLSAKWSPWNNTLYPGAIPTSRMLLEKLFKGLFIYLVEPHIFLIIKTRRPSPFPQI